MPQIDQFGVVQGTDDPAAVRAFDRALWKVLAFDRDPEPEADAAIALDPAFAMPQLLKGSLYALSTERSLLPRARTAVGAVRALERGLGARELAHVAALEDWTAGRFNAACDHWERILAAEPRDALAMFAAHQGDFLLGRTRELRDRVARRLSAIDAGTVLEGFYQGMHAFGLEECGDYERAEQAGHRAVAREPRDAWAIHAVTHVMEMTGRTETGLRWLESRSADWAESSSLAVHNWWHFALFLLKQRRWDEVLRLYDARIARAADTNAVMEMLDASSLLWRLRLQGVDVETRWQPLAAVWETRTEDGWYVFNDLHAMMALASDDRGESAQRLLARLRAIATEDSDNGRVAGSVGIPAAEALLAYAQGHYARAAQRLTPVVAIAVKAGGSHAQRDVFVQTLTAAAERADDGAGHLARAVLPTQTQPRA